MKIKMLAMVVIVATPVLASFAQDQQRETAAERIQRLRQQRQQRQQNGAAANTPANTVANAASGAARPAASDPGEVTMSGETSVMNMDGAALELVLKIYGELVKKTIIVDPAVQGTLNNTIKFKSAPGQSLTDEERIFAYETILEMNQIHLEPYGESFIRALPRKDVRKEGIPLIIDPDAKLGESGRVVSMMINFKNIATDEAQKILEGLKSNSGVLLVFERTNSILVTDTEQNINRMLEISRMVDIATPVTENVFVRQVKNASANDIKTALEAIVQESQKELEKNGKQVPSAAQQPSAPSRLPSLLRRPGQQQQQQPAAPVNNESLVMSVSDADRGMIRGKVLILADERSNKLIIVTSKSNMDFFDKVIEQLDVETTPDTVVKVYRLKYAECEDVSDMINDLIGNAPSSKSTGKANQNQNAKQGTGGNITRNTPATAAKSVNQRTGEAKTGELSKENTTVLADKRINGIVVMTNKELVPVIEQIIESMDIKLSQVLIETAIIEVGLGDDLNTGVNWSRLGDRQIYKQQNVDSAGNPLYYVTKTVHDGSTSGSAIKSKEITTSTAPSWFSKTEIDSDGNLVEYSVDKAAEYLMQAGNSRGGFVNGAGSAALSYMLGGGGSSEVASGILGALAGVGTNSLASISPAGSGLNWYFKSDSLNLAAVVQASKMDSRSKYLASPVVMTLDNKEAVINATEMSYLLKGFTSSGTSYSTVAVPDYEQKELGIEIKVTPKINPNGTVMLTVETKYTQLGANQKIKYSNGAGGSAGLEEVAVPTTITREMSSDVLLENMQTVVFGGLTKTYQSETETGIPLLKDIPWIGKWLFGSVSSTENRTELLVFMTPYVLNDAQAAQAEALRRKKTMSDPRPWEDHGWSLSELADPVSKKEQMRRIKDEAAKQDEERSTRIAIEQWKLERAKKLKEMSKSERDLWLKMHKEELDDERQEELEEKMQDKESQEELKKLAAQVREQKLAEAKVELEKAEEDTKAENERSRIDRENAAAAASPLSDIAGEPAEGNKEEKAK